MKEALVILAVVALLMAVLVAAQARQTTRCVRNPDGSMSCTVINEGCEYVPGGCQ